MENELTLTNVGDTGVSSFVFLDRVHVVYPETPAMRGGRFEGVFSESGVATIAGSARYALDVTSPQDPRWLVRLKRRSGTGEAEGGGPAELPADDPGSAAGAQDLAGRSSRP